MGGLLLEVRVASPTFHHPLVPARPALFTTPDVTAWLPRFPTCTTPYPEPICSCGLYLITWGR